MGRRPQNRKVTVFEEPGGVPGLEVRRKVPYNVGVVDGICQARDAPARRALAKIGEGIRPCVVLLSESGVELEGALACVRAGREAKKPLLRTSTTAFTRQTEKRIIQYPSNWEG